MTAIIESDYVPELFRLRWLVSEMHAELTSPSAEVSGTVGGWPAFAADWCERAKPLLVAPAHDGSEGVRR